MHNVRVRILFKELAKVFVIAVNPVAFVNFEFRFFVSFPELHCSGHINVSDVKQACINVIINGLFTAHQFILLISSSETRRLLLEAKIFSSAWRGHAPHHNFFQVCTLTYGFTTIADIRRPKSCHADFFRESCTICVTEMTELTVDI